MGTGEQAADAALAFETPAEIGPAGVGDHGRVVAIAFLNGARAVVDVVYDALKDPSGAVTLRVRRLV